VDSQHGDLDEIDIRILHALEVEGRASFIEVGERAGLSATAVQRRVKRLEQEGIIRGYRAELDPALVGLELEAFIFVSLEQQARGPADAFKARVCAIPNVRACWMLAGDVDFLVQVQCRDLASFTRLMLDDMLVLPGVKHARSALVLDRVRTLGTFLRASR
jgi:Lrp/AsnC family transcriptional regulator, leucine-responsive regulatory protein